MEFIRETREIPVIHECDVLVVGGGCSGVMAALRAARYGAKVCIVERSNCFGGVATSGLVNVWHSLYDTDYKEQIVFGITDEIEKILMKTGDARSEEDDNCGIRFNPARLQTIYDRLVTKENIKVYFHTFFSSLLYEGKKINAAIVENKDGRGAIKAKFFIDATGDGDLCRCLGLPSFRNPTLQPPSLCFFLQDVPEKPFDIGEIVKKHGDEFGLDDDWGWGGYIPGLDSLTFRADNHVFGVDCSKADDLTFAELDGRRKALAVSDMLRKYVDDRYDLAALASTVGIRDTVHYVTDYRVTEDDLLLGRKFEHTISKGTYRLDVHHHNDNGITFKYLDGRVDTFYGKDTSEVHSNWREERGITGEPAKYYCAPWEMLIQSKYDNFIPVGKMMNAEESAFGALRVMINLNQMGEAAGIGAAMAAESGSPIKEVDPAKIIREKDRY